MTGGPEPDDRPSKAWAAALELLARRDYFRAELGQRLRLKGFATDEVEAALDRCDERGLVDDRRLSGRFARVRAADRGWGPRRIAHELRRRGVHSDLADQASALDPELYGQALELAVSRAEVRARRWWWRLPAGRARMVSSLVNRGFEADDAVRAVDELARCREIQHDANHDLTGDP
jgi:regulatory protein